MSETREVLCLHKAKPGKNPCRSAYDGHRLNLEEGWKRISSHENRCRSGQFFFVSNLENHPKKIVLISDFQLRSPEWTSDSARSSLQRRHLTLPQISREFLSVELPPKFSTFFQLHRSSSMKSHWIIPCFMGPGDRSRRRFRCTPFRISTSPRSFEAPEKVTSFMGKMSIESMFHWEPIFIAPSAKIMSQINHELIPGKPNWWPWLVWVVNWTLRIWNSKSHGGHFALSNCLFRISLSLDMASLYSSLLFHG